MTKAVFLGKFEVDKFSPISFLIKKLKDYNFDTVYVFNDAVNYLKDFSCANFNTFLVINPDDFNFNVGEVIGLVNKYSFISGVCLDHVRVSDKLFGWKGLFSLFKIYKFCRDLRRRLNGKYYLHACLKCEDYSSLWGNELNRLRYGQSILFSKFFDKTLLMSYHQEYGVTLDKALGIVNGLKYLFGQSILPIFQTYQDYPIVNYNLYWEEVSKASKDMRDKIFFRFGCADLKTFE